MNGYDTYQVRNPRSLPKQFKEARVREAVRVVLRRRSARFKRIESKVSRLRISTYGFLFIGAITCGFYKSQLVSLSTTIVSGVIVSGIFAVVFLLCLEAWWARLQDSEVRQHFTDADFETVLRFTSGDKPA